MSGFPYLSLLILLPFTGAALIWLLPPAGWARRIALVTTIAELGAAIAMLAHFSPADGGFQMVERMTWIPSLNIHYFVGVDGISVLFPPLTALLFAAVVLASWTQANTMRRLYFSLVLTLEGVTIGIFLALDTLLFFLFWEMTLVPMFFLVSLCGIGPYRRHAATKYTLLMLAGGLPLMFGFAFAAFQHAKKAGATLPDGLVFDLPTLLANVLPFEAQVAIFLLLLAGFAVKTPVVPLHSWLPTLAMEGPPAVVATVTGLKLGAYGIIRFAVPMAPDAAHHLHWLLAALGVTGILYGALSAMAQTNLRRLLAFSSVSHVGLVVLGLASFSVISLQGAVFQLLSFTTVAGGLFLIAGFLQHRIGSTDTLHLGGAARTMPAAATFLFFLGLAGMGIPATAGFPGEHLILIGTLQTHKGALLAALGGVILGAAYFLGWYRRAFLGPVKNPVVGTAIDLRPREMAVAAVLALMTLAGGLYPASVLETTRTAAEAWVAHLGPR